MKALRYVWAVYFLLLFCIVFVLFYPLFLIFLQKRKWYPYAHKLRAIWGYIIMYASGLWPITIQKSKLDKNKAYVFVANHFSYLDILSLNVQVPHYFRFMAKSELGKIPLFKIFFGTIDISVNRSSIKDSHKAFTYADEALHQGESLGIFPEGRIGNNVPTMSRFKNGAFKLAIENNIAVVPVTILDNWKRLPDGGLENGGTPGKMRVIVHEPIITDPLSLNDMNALSDKVFDIIQNTFNEFNFASKNENPE